METHSSAVPWRIPGAGEPGGVSWVAQSRTQLKRLSSSSSSIFRSVDYIVSVRTTGLCCGRWKKCGPSFNQFSSIAQSHLTLCDPMNCSTPGLPVHHQLLEFTHSCPLSQGCHATISSSVVPFSSYLQSFPASGSFQMSQFFTSGGQNVGVSASASVFQMNIPN